MAVMREDHSLYDAVRNRYGTFADAAPRLARGERVPRTPSAPDGRRSPNASETDQD
jgi:hypothetical protein